MRQKKWKKGDEITPLSGDEVGVLSLEAALYYDAVGHRGEA
ncbi:hypothetical protein [Bradyrhizobium sp. USDA 3458]|nr:hypothetical protein [Bradyrhizobium sp. USDA 3458]